MAKKKISKYLKDEMSDPLGMYKHPIRKTRIILENDASKMTYKKYKDLEALNRNG